MHNRPTGTVTFLFTDIEGSTRHWDQHPVWMQRAFARQEAIIRAAVAAQGGYAYKMIGDAFQAAFATAPQALAAALAAQAELQAEAWGAEGPLQVRMALHTGVTEERGDDYVGPALNRAARTLSLGHGGQILLTQATYDLLQEPTATTLPGVRLTALGEHRLRDMARAEQIYQATAPGLLSQFPALESSGVIPHNLPAPVKSFIGRAHESEHVRRLLLAAEGDGGATRLVTLTGPGGSGKTELALRVAHAVLERFPEGVWLVELAALSEPRLVPEFIRNTLGLRDDPGQPPLEALVEFFKPRRALLLLDNCEHLVGACAEVAHALLRACPNLRLLATSREALEVPGETVISVPPLATPGPDEPQVVAELARVEAVRLFVERAQAAFADFELTVQNASAVATIVRRLDGLPLAIELAAARVRLLSAAQIAARLEDRFRLLTDGRRTPLPRHQTLRTTIEWSFALLAEPEQVLFRRLSVLAGGWTLEAAEAICDDGSGSVLDHLAQLVNKSLVSVERWLHAETRYGMLETIRAFARERLGAAHEAEDLAGRHLAYYAGLARAAQPQLRGPDQVAWLDRLEAEHENLRAALAAAVESEPALGLSMAADLWWFWHIRGHLLEGCEWLERLLAAEASQAPGETGPGDRARTRAQAQVVAAFLYFMRSNLERGTELAEAALAQFQTLGAAGRQGAATALAYLCHPASAKGDWGRVGELSQQSLALFRELDDRFGMAEALDGLHLAARATGQYAQAAALSAEALALRRAIGDLDGIASELYYLADLAIRQQQFEQATSSLQESLALYETAGNRSFVVRVRILLGLVAWVSGQPAQATSHLDDALALSRLVPESVGAIFALLWQGDVALSQGDYEQTVERYQAFVARARQAGDRRGLAWGLQRLGKAARINGDYEQAGQRLSEALALARDTPLSRVPQSLALFDLAMLALRQGDCALARSRLAESIVIQRDSDDTMGLAHSLPGFAVIAVAEGQFERAARLFGAAERFAHLIAHTLPPVDRAEYDRAMQTVGERLGEARCAALWAEGRALSLAQAVELALAGGVGC